jgi:hypothetical protein
MHIGHVSLGRPRYRFVLKCILEREDRGGMDWINLA